MIVAILALALGGVLKGATGAGAPLLAIPALAALYDVQLAVALMLMPNLLTNLWQAWRFRAHRPAGGFVLRFAAGGAAGVVFGSYALATLPREALSLIVAVGVAGYIVLRLAKRDWMIPAEAARRLALPVGVGAGVLQGASGVSAPISISFLNAMRLERPVFIAAISIFFFVVSLLQIPALAALGIVTWETLAMSLGAVAPILAAMPLGGFLARRFSAQVFDRVMLGVLAILAAKLATDALL